MEITTFPNIMRVISTFQFIFEKGLKVSHSLGILKIAVHCHAGTGRTGVGIAAWLIYGERLSAVDAIKLFQSKRASSLSKSAHQDLLKNFEKCKMGSLRKYLDLAQNRKCFGYPRMPIKTIEHLVECQNRVLFGKDKSKARDVPIVMYKIFSKLEELIVQKQVTAEECVCCFYDLENKQHFKDAWSILFDNELNRVKDQFNQHIFDLGYVSDLRILCQAVLDFFEELPKAAISDDLPYKLARIKNDGEQLEQLFVKEECTKIMSSCQFQILDFTAKFAQ